MSFTHYKTVTLDPAQAGSYDSSGWVLKICLDGNVQPLDLDLKTVGNGGYVQNAGGFDVRPCSAIGLVWDLNYELESYDGATGKLVMNVYVSTLSVTTPVVIYLAFGDSGLTTDDSNTAPWISNYNVVAHLGDGVTPNFNDSSGFGYNGTPSGSPTAVTGQLDGGVAFNSTVNSQFVSWSSGPILNGASQWTFSCWVKVNAIGADHMIWSENISTVGGVVFLIRITDTGKAEAVVIGPAGAFASFATGATTLSANTWYHVVCSMDGSTLYTYVNGVLDGSGSLLGYYGGPFPTDGVWTGKIGNVGVEGSLDGVIDEIRVSPSNFLGESWGIADYNSQKSSSTFITWGGLVAVGGGASYSDSVSEGSATAVDTPSAILAAKASVAEGSATATDIPSAATSTNAAIAEGSATSADTPSVIRTTPAAIAEGSATATDAQDASTTFPATVAEGSATAVDIPDVIRTTPASTSEGSATSADTQDSTAAQTASTAEGSASASDSPSATAQFASTVSEGSATATDTPSATAALAASTSEGSATATDAQDATVTSNAASIAEGSATAQDSSDATVIFQGSVAEGSATAQDTQAAAALWAAFIAEGSATASDTPDATRTTPASIAEGSATASDTPSASVAATASVAEGNATASDTPSAVASLQASIAEISVMVATTNGVVTYHTLYINPDRNFRITPSNRNFRIAPSNRNFRVAPSNRNFRIAPADRNFSP